MKKKKIVIAGGSGLIGKALTSHFHTEASIVILSRRASQRHDTHRSVQWDAKSFGDWQRELEDCDILINLTGKSIQCRFTDENKKELRASRIDSTKVLSESIAQLSKQPHVWFNASGSGYYPPMDRPFSEDDIQAPHDFLGRLCQDWENELFRNKTLHTRRVAMRISPVLDSKEGALMPAKMAARFGAGGKQGNGKQLFSWIHIKDLVRAIEFVIDKEDLHGPINFCAPEVVSNSAFMASVRKAVGMPIGIPAPAFLIKLMSPVLGIESSLALDSKNIIPKRLQDAKFRYDFPELDQALTDLL